MSASQVAQTRQSRHAISSAIVGWAKRPRGGGRPGFPRPAPDLEEMRMLFSRWKLLTGAFGLSIGGIATLGGTTPPAADSPLVVRADEKLNVPPPPSVTPTTVAAVPTLPALPAIPASVPPALPAPVSSPVVELPGLPLPESKPTETKLPPSTLPPKPMDVPVVPASGTLPALPKADVIPPANVPNPSLTPPMPKPVAFEPPSLPPMPKPVEPSLPPLEYSSPAPRPETIPTRPSTPPVAAAPSKFRILLRVGAGDPSFEVRHDDDLVMKVVCEKVDIKSPDKGQGPSNVVATGKVRFVGFGAEGTCDSFSFLAGTGEVSLTGNVNVKVRDKIGRVESELNADKMQYKLDPNALTGTLKP